VRETSERRAGVKKVIAVYHHPKRWARDLPSFIMQNNPFIRLARMTVPLELTTLLKEYSSSDSATPLQSIIDKLHARYGTAIQAIVFYGSCLRSGDVRDGLIDLYVVVDGYRSAYGNTPVAFLNTLLPPNVFYVTCPDGDRTVRAKYAVLSMRDFKRSTAMGWFHSYFWGRFCQPVRIVWSRTEQVEQEIHEACGQAIRTFLTRVLPMLPSEFNARMLWEAGLGLSYRAELRAERTDVVTRLFDSAADYYERLTALALKTVPHPITVISHHPPSSYRADISNGMRRRCRLAWMIRRTQGKILSCLRLLKALLTFQGGVDYILWKIERHSGITVEVTPRLRRYPLLVGWVVFWRLYRRGAFR